MKELTASRTLFPAQIEKMNRMYDLEVHSIPRLNLSMDLFLARLERFNSILTEECKELDDILVRCEQPMLDNLTDLADLLGDLIVYCYSEAAKFGIPLDEVLGIIMESNFSKLPEDGKPLKDERGKFLKGPNYWKPEPRIKALLQRHFDSVKVLEKD